MRTPKVISATTVEPVTLGEACEHLRLVPVGSPGEYPDEALVEALITVAREAAEKFTGRSIVQRVLELALDQFPVTMWWTARAIELPMAPFQSLTSIDYDDGGGVETPLADYQLDWYSEPARLVPLAGVTTWPSTQTGALNAVRIRYVVGYYEPVGSPAALYDDLPKSIKRAMLLTIGHFYENREDTSIARLEQIPLGAQALLRPYRIQDAMA